MIGRYVFAFGGLAILGYFIVQLAMAKHLAGSYKFGTIAVIVIVGISGAMAILERDPDAPASDGQRLYTADEVAELLELARANGDAGAGAPNATSTTCVFCGKGGAEVRGLDGTRYHRPCFQNAYREREEAAPRPTSLR